MRAYEGENTRRIKQKCTVQHGGRSAGSLKNTYLPNVIVPVDTPRRHLAHALTRICGSVFLEQGLKQNTHISSREALDCPVLINF